MIEIHAHEILRMMEGNTYTTATLKEAIIEKFGAEARFNTCSAKEMDADAIIEFLTAKGKFKPTDSGFTMDITKVCSDY
ncbi:MAG: YecH family metal-binding protein [Rikenellaceae bacterium]